MSEEIREMMDCPNCKGKGKIPKPTKVDKLEKVVKELKKRIKDLEGRPLAPPIDLPIYPRPWKKYWPPIEPDRRHPQIVLYGVTPQEWKCEIHTDEPEED